MPPAETGKYRQKAGRREKPLPGDGKPRTVLAAQLRELKSACGSPTYDELAGLSGVYKTGLLDAASATRLPPWYVIAGYVEGCWRYYEGRFGTPFADAGELSRWHQLYRDAGGTMPGESLLQETGERDQQAEPRLGPAPTGDVLAAYSVPEVQDAAGGAPRLTRARWARMGGGPRYPVHVAARIAAAALLVAAAVVVIIAAAAVWPLRPAPAGPDAARRATTWQRVPAPAGGHHVSGGLAGARTSAVARTADRCRRQRHRVRAAECLPRQRPALPDRGDRRPGRRAGRRRGPGLPVHPARA